MSRYVKIKKRTRIWEDTKTGAFVASVEGPRDPATGKRKPKMKRGFKSIKSAHAWQVKQQHSKNEGTWREPSKATVAVYLRQWLETLRPPASNLRQTTWEQYRTLAESYVIPRLGAVLLQKLEPQQLDILYGDLLRDGRVGGNGRASGGALSTSTVHKVHVVLHRALKDAVRKGTLARNVADFADPPSPANGEKDSWTAEELRAFLEWVKEERLYSIYHLESVTGLRRGEVLGLPWDAVDLDEGRISIRQQLTTTTSEYQPHLSDVKTKAGRRNLALDAQTVAILRGWRKRQIEDRVFFGEAWQDKGLVFTREDGAWIHPQTLSEWFDKAVKASGLRRITFHGLRHTFASLALGARIPVEVVSKRLGHSSIKVTFDVYRHVIPKEDEDAAAVFAEKVLGNGRR